MKPATLPTPIYGSFESCPARFTDYEAWVFWYDDAWREFNAAEVLFHAGVMAKAKFEKDFRTPPPLPARAFASPPNAEIQDSD